MKFLKLDTFLDLDLQTATKAISYSGFLASWVVGIGGLAILQFYQDYLDTLMMSVAIYGFVLDLCHAGSCLLALKGVRERSDYKLIPWLVISFVTTLSIIAAGVTLVMFWINQFYFFAAACIVLTLFVTWLSVYVWVAVASLYADFKYLRKILEFRPTPNAKSDPENPPVTADAKESKPKATCVPVMVDYNTMRFPSVN